MAAKKRGLGRGLDALLAGSALAAVDKESSSSEVELSLLPIEFIQRGKYQPRRDMNPEALDELAASIRAQGVMQPILVRSVAHDRYEIIAGERRWRASQLAGLDSVPVIIRQVEDDAAVAMALIENIQREDLNPIEEAIALQRLQQEFELNQQQVADAVGKSRSTVTNLLRLMSLSDDVKILLEHGDLEMGHARCMLSLEAPAQKELADVVIAKGLSVRQCEAMVRKLLEPVDEKAPKPVEQSADVRNLEERLAQTLGAGVTIKHGAKGKGKIVIAYNSLDELDGVIAHIK